MTTATTEAPTTQVWKDIDNSHREQAYKLADELRAVRSKGDEASGEEKEKLTRMIDSFLDASDETREAQRKHEIRAGKETLGENLHDPRQHHEDATTNYDLMAAAIRKIPDGGVVRIYADDPIDADFYRHDTFIETKGNVTEVRGVTHRPPELKNVAKYGIGAEYVRAVGSVGHGQTVGEIKPGVNNSNPVGLIPESFYGSPIEIMEFAAPMFSPQVSRIVDTSTLEDFQIPAQAAFSLPSSPAERKKILETKIQFHSPPPTLKAKVAAGMISCTDRFMRTTQFSSFMEFAGNDLVETLARTAQERCTIGGLDSKGAVVANPGEHENEIGLATTAGAEATGALQDPIGIVAQLQYMTDIQTKTKANATANIRNVVTMTKNTAGQFDNINLVAFLKVLYEMDAKYASGHWLMNRQLFGNLILNTSTSRFEGAPVASYGTPAGLNEVEQGFEGMLLTTRVLNNPHLDHETTPTGTGTVSNLAIYGPTQKYFWVRRTAIELRRSDEFGYDELTTWIRGHFYYDIKLVQPGQVPAPGEDNASLAGKRGPVILVQTKTS